MNKTLVVLKDGVQKMIGNGDVKADGSVRIFDRPIVLKSECDRLGLDPKVVLKKQAPSECLARMGLNAGGVEVIAEEENDVRRAAAQKTESDLLESKIPGINEMRRLEWDVINEYDRFSSQFEQMMSDEQNDGARPPERLRRELALKLDEMKKSNPRAALYIRAEKQAKGTTSYSATSGEMKGGADAIKCLLAGQSIEAAEKALAFRY